MLCNSILYFVEHCSIYNIGKQFLTNTILPDYASKDYVIVNHIINFKKKCKFENNVNKIKYFL